MGIFAYSSGMRLDFSLSSYVIRIRNSSLLNLFDPINQGITRWVMVICGLFIFSSHLKFILDKKSKTRDNQKKTY